MSDFVNIFRRFYHARRSACRLALLGFGLQSDGFPSQLS
jgi:hypothetical protein